MADAAVIEDVVGLFTWQDYAVFGSMLAVSAAIGVYHGFSCRRKPTGSDDEKEGVDDFLKGSGKMRTLPVALSMLASFMSSITLMGQPAEVYRFGPQLWVMGVAMFAAVPVISYVFVPFFRNLNTTSAYEYFGQRFSRKFQLFASSIFSLQMLLFLALVLYAPALALHQVTGINPELVIIVMYIVCIFYTTVGGIKAVIWTDSFQVVVFYAAMFAVLIKGTLDIGGFSVVWERNAAHQRGTLFDFDLGLTKRYSFWNVFIGSIILHMSVMGGNQLQIQRYMTVPSIKAVRNMMWINAVGWTLILILTTYAGMLIFAKYVDCDPLLKHAIKSPDQLFPYYVMDALSQMNGFPGLFVAGIFSAGLSTVSTGVNSLAAIWFAELEGTEFKAKLSPRNAQLTVKGMALLFGLMSFALVFVVPFMGNLVPIAISLSGFFSGSLMAVFLLGMYVPFANTWGAFAGLTSGTGFVGWMTIGVQTSINEGLLVFQPLPLSTEGCSAINSTISSSITEVIEKEPAFVAFRVSFMWYSLIAAVVTFAVGTIVSLLCRCMSPRIPVPIVFRAGSDFNRRMSTELGKELTFMPISRSKHTKPNLYIASGRELEPKLLITEEKAPVIQ